MIIRSVAGAFMEARGWVGEGGNTCRLASSGGSPSFVLVKVGHLGVQARLGIRAVPRRGY